MKFIGIQSAVFGKRYSKSGMTLIELIAAMAIAGIVLALAISMFMIPQKVLTKGGNRSDVQFNLRMVSDSITSEVRLSSAVEILADGYTIPFTVSNDDKYIFVDNSNGALVVRDKDGDHTLFYADDLQLNFSVIAPFKALTYAISGLSDGEAFALNSQVNALNLPSDKAIADSSGTSEGTIIKIENNLPSVDPIGLFFILQTPHEGTINESFFRSFTPNNANGLCSYSFVNGNLPDGISLNSSGYLSGTATAIGNFIFSIRLTDTLSSVTRTFAINIVPAVSNITLPVASDLTVTGSTNAGSTLTGTYTYSDPDGQAEQESLAVWYRMDDSYGTNKTVVQSTTTTAIIPSTYILTSNDSGKYIVFEVTPKTADGRIGNPVSFIPISIRANLAPTAVATINSSDPKNKFGCTLTGSYIYTDADNDVELGTTFQWYRAKKVNDPLIAISGATNTTYKTTSADKNYLLYFGVTPRAATGVRNGDQTISANIEIKP